MLFSFDLSHGLHTFLEMATVSHANGPPSSPPNYEERRNRGCAEIVLIIISYILVIIFFPFAICYCIRTVQEYERAVIFRLGRLVEGGAKGPGSYFQG